ncbi:MAG: transporter substrate-binding domain-containing protein [Desulfuromonadaceae bacterium]
MTRLTKCRSFPTKVNVIRALATFIFALLMPISIEAEQTAPVIHVGSEIDFPPYAIVDAKGRASGFSVELLEAVTEAMALSVKVTTGPWPEVLAAFKAGKTDLLPLVALSAKRADMATYTKPHTVAYDSFFVRKGDRPIASLAEAKGKEVIAMSSDAAHEELHHSGLPVRIIETKTIPEAMRLLASGRHDAVLVPKLLGLIVLRETKLEEVIEAGKPIADYNRQFAFAVQRGNTELRDKLEQGLAIVHTTGRYDAIYRKWFGRIDPQKRLLKTIIVNNYHPYTYLNEKGAPDGFSVEIAKAVAKTMDLDLEIRADKWDLSMKELETGGIDLIPMMAHSPERDLLFDFSVPYTIAYDTIFFKKGVKDIRSLNDLNGKTVIVTNNDAAHGYLLSSGLSKTMNISLANSLPDALKQLAAGKGDAAIMPKLVGLVVAKNLNLTEIEVSPEIIADYSRPWCFAVRNGDQAMLDRLNQGLNIIKATGEYDAIYKKWFGALEGTKLQLETILMYGSAGVLILLGFLVWNVMLKRQVKSKTEHLEAEIAVRMRVEDTLRGSEERFKKMFRNHSAVMLLLEPESGEIIDANLAAENFYGYTHEGLLSLNISDINILTPESIAAERHAALEEKRNHFIFPHRLADGDIRTVEVYSTPITVNNSTLLFSIIHDITERKRAEDALRESESEFRSLAEAMPQIVWITRPDGWNIFFNKQWMDYTGLTLEESCGHGWIKPFHPDDRQRAWDAWQNATQNNDVYSLECRLRRADGVYKWWLVRGVHVQDTKGAILKWFGTCTDIHELKQVEQELQAKNTEMERFAYTVSHDLKSPLITIQAYAGMIKKDLETGKYERAQDDMQRIEGAADKMTSLLNDLLELSRVGRQMGEPSLIDMNLLVSDVLAQLTGVVTQSLVGVVVQPDLPAVHGDPKRIAEVVQNLIENAIKYRSDQTVPCIEIGTRQDGRECVFFVKDNGKGIDPCHHEKVFGLFNKLDGDSEGTGVGLALVKRIIEVHGGRVWVESEGEGMGSCFCFTLPG